MIDNVIFEDFKVVYQHPTLTIDTHKIGLTIIFRTYGNWGNIDLQASCKMQGYTTSNGKFPRVTGLFGTYDGDTSNDFWPANCDAKALENRNPNCFTPTGSLLAFGEKSFGETYNIKNTGVESYFPNTNRRRLQSSLIWEDNWTQLELNLTSIDPNFLLQAEILCGKSSACFYDAVVTKDLTIAEVAVQHEQEIEAKREQIIAEATKRIPRCYTICKNGVNCK
eukprot:487159_1